ncbi:hypothetical protein MTO96_014101 [Rhipicephalus appendiculatus]
MFRFENGFSEVVRPPSTEYEEDMDEWERQETGAGIPYYVNHRKEKTQWDHPEMVLIIEKLTSFNDIKYAAYRTGAKLIYLQKELLLCFGAHGLEGASQHELLLGCAQVEAILEDLYKRAPGVHQQKVPLLASLALNLLQNLFDAKRKGTIQVLQMKIALFVFCAGRLLDKLKYICNELQDGTHRISYEELESFLHNISKIPEFLGEKLSFGAHFVPAAVESCRKLAPALPAVPDDMFLNWLLREPQNLVWISTFYRMRSTENVAHPMKCGACKTYPIVGLRYQCLQCLNYDLCQSCFLHGNVSKNHSIKHRMQEHCQQTSSWEKVKAPTPNPRLQRKALKRIECHHQMKLDCVKTMAQNNAHMAPCMDTLHQQELESIIERLERENRNLAREVAAKEHGTGSPTSVPSSPLRQRYLHQHLAQVEVQLKRMRSLLQVLSREEMGGTDAVMCVPNGVAGAGGVGHPCLAPMANPAWLQSTPANGGRVPCKSMDRFMEIHNGLKAMEAPINAPTPPPPPPTPSVVWELRRDVAASSSTLPEPPSPIACAPPSEIVSACANKGTLDSAKECTFGDLTSPVRSTFLVDPSSTTGMGNGCATALPGLPLDGELESILRQLDDLLSEPKQAER